MLADMCGGVVVHVQTTASWVAELSPGGCRHWVTATSAPCTSLFKPVYVDRPLDLDTPGENPDESLWWRHERLHRMVVKDPETFFPLFEEERNAIERNWVESPPDSAEAFAEHGRLLERWIEKASQVQARDTRPVYVRAYWKKRDRMIGAK